MGILKQLSFPAHIQLRPYSCSAAVLQMVIKHLTGDKIRHVDAIEYTDCRPAGCTMARLKTAIRQFDVTVGTCPKRQASIRRALDEDKLVIIDDSDSYKEPHVELITGYGGSRFWVVDPMRLWPRFRAGKNVIKSADECFTAYLR